MRQPEQFFRPQQFLHPHGRQAENMNRHWGLRGQHQRLFGHSDGGRGIILLKLDQRRVQQAAGLLFILHHGVFRPSVQHGCACAAPGRGRSLRTAL